MSGELYQMYFFEHILSRIAKSKYKNNIILKGGLLLSSIIGNDMRTTKDLDATIKSIKLEKENVYNIIKEILNIDIGDGILYEVVSIVDIREEDEYGGFRVNIIAHLEMLKIHLSIELTTGDKITPREIEYKYRSIFGEEVINIFAYTLETIIAEKYHSIITRGVYNTRMKDYYDIYTLLKGGHKINYNNLKQAIQNTFAHRNTEINIEEIRDTIEEIKESAKMQSLWEKYKDTAIYAKGIEYAMLFPQIEKITNSII